MEKLELKLYSPFCTHKIAETMEDVQDAYAYEVNSEYQRYAIADGATQAFYSASWAKLLVHHFCRESSTEDIRTLFDTRDWKEWLDPIQQQWYDELTNWHSQEKIKAEKEGKPFFLVENRFIAKEPAAATFIGLEFDHTDNNQIKWKAMIIGDSCLFHFNEREKIFDNYLVQKSEDFTSQPKSFASYPKDNRDTPQFRNGTVKTGDSFILATDALAKWILRQREAGQTQWDRAWQQLHQIRTESDFRNFIDQLRQDKKNPIDNDDVTLLILSTVDLEKKESPPPTTFFNAAKRKLTFLLAPVFILLILVGGYLGYKKLPPLDTFFPQLRPTPTPVPVFQNISSIITSQERAITPSPEIIAQVEENLTPIAIPTEVPTIIPTETPIIIPTTIPTVISARPTTSPLTATPTEISASMIRSTVDSMIVRTPELHSCKSVILEADSEVKIMQNGKHVSSLKLTEAIEVQVLENDAEPQSMTIQLEGWIPKSWRPKGKPPLECISMEDDKVIPKKNNCGLVLCEKPGNRRKEFGKFVVYEETPQFKKIDIWGVSKKLLDCLPSKFTTREIEKELNKLPRYFLTKEELWDAIAPKINHIATWENQWDVLKKEKCSKLDILWGWPADSIQYIRIQVKGITQKEFLSCDEN